jgi:hypothetical protein
MKVQRLLILYGKGSIGIKSKKSKDGSADKDEIYPFFFLLQLLSRKKQILVIETKVYLFLFP